MKEYKIIDVRTNDLVFVGKLKDAVEYLRDNEYNKIYLADFVDTYCYYCKVNKLDPLKKESLDLYKEKKENE